MTYDHNNIFAKILRGEIPCNKAYEDEFALAFHDITPAAPKHILVIPKGNYTSFNDFTTSAPVSLIHGFFAAVQKVAAQEGLEKTGYRIISNHGTDASQSVPHFHIHVLGGTSMGHLLP